MRRIALAFFAVLAMTFGVVSTAGAQDQYNCDDFTYQEEAQAVYNQNTNDPHGLDGPIGPNNDTRGTPGLACEDLPSRGTSGDGGGAGNDNGDDDGNDNDDDNGDDNGTTTLPETGTGAAASAGSAASLFGAVAGLLLIVGAAVRRTAIFRA